MAKIFRCVLCYSARLLRLTISNVLQVECPTGSGDYMNLAGVAEEIQHRIIHIFGRDVEGRRATNGGNPRLDRDPHFRDYVWFYEVRLLKPCSVYPCVNNGLGGFSSSTLIMDVDSAHHIRLGGMHKRLD